MSRGLTTWINLVFLVTCSDPQAKFPVSNLNARYFVFPPRVLTSWIRFAESSFVRRGVLLRRELLLGYPDHRLPGLNTNHNARDALVFGVTLRPSRPPPVGLFRRPYCPDLQLCLEGLHRLRLSIVAVRIAAVQAEHHESGFGIGVATPRVSWRFAETDVKDWVQQSYELGITGNGKEQIDSVDSSESSLVPWPSIPWISGEVAGIRVRTKGKDGWTD